MTPKNEERERLAREIAESAYTELGIASTGFEKWLNEKLQDAINQLSPTEQAGEWPSEDAWAILASADGSTETALVFGDKSKAREKLLELMWFGKPEEALQDPMISAIIENFDNPDWWSNDGHRWEEQLEQGLIQVTKIRTRLSRPTASVEIGEERVNALDDAKCAIETYRGSQIFDGEKQRDPVGTLLAVIESLKTRTFLEWPSVKAGHWEELKAKRAALRIVNERKGEKK